ncbi:protein of unknown function [Cyanobium sp. NIES-981]|nr:protein of unknown function [Cyanobium sp. NIES-981]
MVSALEHPAHRRLCSGCLLAAAAALVGDRTGRGGGSPVVVAVSCDGAERLPPFAAVSRNSRRRRG